MSNFKLFCRGYLVGIITFGLLRLTGETVQVTNDPFTAGIALGLVIACAAVALFGDRK